MGNSAAGTAVPAPAPAAAVANQGATCPVRHLGGKAPPAPTQTEECPVKHKYKNPSVYNVYSQKLDPSNQMPVVPAQSSAPGQGADLSTSRVKSTIPKGGTDDDTWLYPSPQMFWNALVRKNKRSFLKLLKRSLHLFSAVLIRNKI